MRVERSSDVVSIGGQCVVSFGLNIIETVCCLIDFITLILHKGNYIFIINKMKLPIHSTYWSIIYY